VSDPTESIRREMVADLNSNAGERAALEARYGQVWSTDEVRAEFEVTGFMAPMVTVVRKSDNQRGSLMFQHNPRFYFDFSAYNG
jgi:hypothetical protein